MVKPSWYTEKKSVFLTHRGKTVNTMYHKISLKKIENKSYLFCMVVCLAGGEVCASEHAWRSKNNLCKLIFSFYNELRSSGLVANTFICYVISPVHNFSSVVFDFFLMKPYFLDSFSL